MEERRELPGQAQVKSGHMGILYGSLTATVRRLELGGKGTRHRVCRRGRTSRVQ